MFDRIIDGALADHCRKDEPAHRDPRRLPRDARRLDVSR